MDVKDSQFIADGCNCNHTVVRNLQETLPKYVGKLEAQIIRKDGTVEAIAPSYNARVNAGAAAEYAALFSGTAGANFNYIALTATAITPASGDTSLSGEITTNGCSRAQASVAYTAPGGVGGQYTATLTHTFTCSGSAQNVNSIGLFNASSAGTMFSEIALSSQASLNVGDSLAITYAISS